MSFFVNLFYQEVKNYPVYLSIRETQNRFSQRARHFIYEPHKLWQRYKQIHKDDPLKSKNLTIVNIKEKKEREKVIELMKQWLLSALEKGDQCAEQRLSFTKETPAYKEISNELSLLRKSSIVLEQALREIEPTQDISTAITDDGEIQGVSITSKNHSRTNARTINFILCAPNNLRTRYTTPTVEGVGTALIEYAIVQALKANARKPTDLATKTNDCAAVTLRTEGDTAPFYKKLYFQEYIDENVENRILEKENLITFLLLYGGRANIDKSIIVI